MTGAEVWALVSQLLPVVLGWFISDQKRKAEAEARFETWVAKHKADGNLSADLSQSYATQADALRARAALRDQATAPTLGQTTPSPVNPNVAPSVATSPAPRIPLT